jgi:hypothetical protein
MDFVRLRATGATDLLVDRQGPGFAVAQAIMGVAWLLAVPPARRAARLRPATILRSE